MTPVKLNLGCGRFPLPGYVNVDCVKLQGVDMVHDLNKMPCGLGQATARMKSTPTM